MKFLAKIDAPVIAGGINVKNDFVAANRDKLVRFLKGYMEGIHFLLSNKRETIKIFSDYLGARDPKVIEFFYSEIAGRVEKNLRPDPESVRFTLDFIGRIHPKAKEVKSQTFRIYPCSKRFINLDSPRNCIDKCVSVFAENKQDM